MQVISQGSRQWEWKYNPRWSFLRSDVDPILPEEVDADEFEKVIRYVRCEEEQWWYTSIEEWNPKRIRAAQHILASDTITSKIVEWLEAHIDSVDGNWVYHHFPYLLHERKHFPSQYQTIQHIAIPDLTSNSIHSDDWVIERSLESCLFATWEESDEFDPIYCIDVKQRKVNVEQKSEDKSTSHNQLTYTLLWNDSTLQENIIKYFDKAARVRIHYSLLDCVMPEPKMEMESCPEWLKDFILKEANCTTRVIDLTLDTKDWLKYNEKTWYSIQHMSPDASLFVLPFPLGCTATLQIEHNQYPDITWKHHVETLAKLANDPNWLPLVSSIEHENPITQ